MLILLHGKGKRKLFHRTSSKNRQMFSRNILVNINTDYYQRISSEIFIDLDNMTFSSNFFLLKRPQEIRWIEYGSVRRLISCHSAPWDVKTKELSSCCGKKAETLTIFLFLLIVRLNSLSRCRWRRWTRWRRKSRRCWKASSATTQKTSR